MGYFSSGVKIGNYQGLEDCGPSSGGGGDEGWEGQVAGGWEVQGVEDLEKDLSDEMFMYKMTTCLIGINDSQSIGYMIAWQMMISNNDINP